jgi:uncharacterized surface protein with fasciclin (FAS1) repeats
MKNLMMMAAALLVSVVTPSIGHAAPAGRSDKNIVEIAVGAGNFKTLAAALDAADLVKTLSGPGPYTVFAPTDNAFSRLPAGTVERLLADKKALTDVLLYHVAAGERSPRQLLLSGNVTTVGGKDVAVSVSGKKFLINDSVLIADPIYTSNGVIYVIDAVLLP